VHSTAARARTRTDEDVRMHARDRAGRWLVFHASHLRDTKGASSHTAVVVEPAKPSDVSSMLAAAYGLTDRELQITQLIARGLSTVQLANRLHISRHTVGDHVKAIFAKTGVATRGELVAKLYVEQYSPLNPDARIRIWNP
jgi:DNA-binding CsgD family transcriptional regulator